MIRARRQSLRMMIGIWSIRSSSPSDRNDRRTRGKSGALSSRPRYLFLEKKENVRVFQTWERVSATSRESEQEDSS